MLAKKLTVNADELGNPASPVWRKSRAEHVELTGTPLGLQPSPYIAVSRQDKPVGQVTQLRVKSLHNGEEVAFCLEWTDPQRNVEISDNDVFPDGVALLFPLVEDAPLITMGAEEKPVNAWHWRADRPDRARSNVAAGLGTSRVTDESSISTAADYVGDRWRIVFRRPLRVSAAADEAVQMDVGQTLNVAFAVWEGANGERGGLKSFSPSWHVVTLES
jgi:DMSO reductase family type II enzyme heme b subunit